MTEIIRKRFNIEVPAQGAAFKDTRILDSDTIRVRGMALCADRDDQLFHRATVGIRLNGREIFPEDYQAKLLMFGLGVEPQKRYFPLEEEPGNFSLEIKVTDHPNPVLPFSPYIVSVYVELEK